MTKKHTTLMQDRQYRNYFLFLVFLCLLLFFAAFLFRLNLTSSARTMLLTHDEAVASSLIEQGVPETVIAKALTETEPNAAREGSALLAKLGIRPALETKFLPPLHHFSTKIQMLLLAAALPFSLLLLGASLFFLSKRERLYTQVTSTVGSYIDGDYSDRLPQTDEGAVWQMCAAVDRLATMLRAQAETEQKSKVFLKNTISDISHQLKTPLSALSMYQEIMENEPDHPDVIRKFTAKTGLSLRRMENLIDSLLKITRLDAGSVVFEKKQCSLRALISQAISELTTRAANEEKRILWDGPDATLFCDPTWTEEAVGNLVKNALDHTDPQGIIRITWDSSPFATRIQVIDNGEGIAPEDFYHIFKRFYRKAPSDVPGIGLGLPLAKSIVEGQGGTISVSDTPEAGATFTILFPCRQP